MKTTTKKAPAKRAATAKPAAPKKAAPKPVAGSTAGAPPVRLSKIGLVILYVKDPIASLAFYRDVLGMTVLEQSPEWAELDAGGMHLALHSHPSIPADRGSACSWVVFSVDDVFATYRALLARGVKFLGEPKQVCGDERKAGMSADLKDPDGNPLSLFGFVTKK
jgi:catechol 2,3-dioxygenase-like lactoylglutathione lyase family enzyme